MSKNSRVRVAAKVLSRTLPPPEPTFFVRWSPILASSIVVLAALVAYHNSFSGPFIFDDQVGITDNLTIKHLPSALSPPSDAATGGRPLLNLTFALNYALGGMDVWGYHVLNLMVHVLAGLTLFGIVRRTLLRPVFAGLRRAGFAATDPGTISQGLSPAEALPLALAVAVIWVVHPLQTEAVTYISQRAESLMGLFYLLTLYCFIRGADATGEGREARGERPEDSTPTLNSQLSTLSSGLWFSGSILACLLGTMSKEIIVTAPVMVLLYDRTFVAGSFREAWRQRWRYYLGLAVTWLLLARLMTGLNQRGAGFEEGVTWWSYALTSCRSVVLYLKLAVWPHPLLLDYGTDVVQHASEIVPYALILALLLAGTAIALWRCPVIGFASAWLFLILSPTTSIVPVAGQPMAEHRMYLPLAAVVTAGVLGLYAWIGRRSMFVLAAAAVGLGWLSVLRNEDYLGALTICKDTVTKCPGNARAHYNLGMILMRLGRSQEAIAEYEATLQIKPGYAEAHNNLGVELTELPGRLPEAISHFEAALRIKPNFAEAHNNLGKALAKIPGRLPEAISQYETALRINPDLADVHYNLGGILAKIPDRLPEAISHYEAALKINPDFTAARNNLGAVHNNLGLLLRQKGNIPAAIAEYKAALQIRPAFTEAHNNLGFTLSNIPGRLPDAILEYEAALKINPAFVQAYYNLGGALSQQGRYAAASEAYEEALKLKPDYAEGHVDLGVTLGRMGRLNDAIAQFETALQIKPDDPSAHRYLELARNLQQKSHDRDLGEHPTP